MRVSNFINLSVVAGFFIGLAVGLIKSDEPEIVLFLTIVVTICMYLISLSMAAIYIYFIDPKQSMLNDKEQIEKQLEYFDAEFDVTEKKVHSIKRFIHDFNFSDYKAS